MFINGVVKLNYKCLYAMHVLTSYRTILLKSSLGIAIYLSVQAFPYFLDRLCEYKVSPISVNTDIILL